MFKFTNSFLKARSTFPISFIHSSTRCLSQQDPYKVMGVSKDASANEIKKKYYQLAKEFHPDTSKDPKAKDKFLDIQNAYEILR
jgi:molecular chaperone DnaJ